ncbi:hypothetical protein AALM99_07500 [Lactococcus muris]|uniref:Uncharacterized protein n=1 Tax=Lactococcus muris TaxID=2941330 RepID=A0ABV4DB58_9LACT
MKKKGVNVLNILKKILIILAPFLGVMLGLILGGAVLIYFQTFSETKQQERQQYVDQKETKKAEQLAVKKFQSEGYSVVAKVEHHIGDYFTVTLINPKVMLSAYTHRNVQGEFYKLSVDFREYTQVWVTSESLHTVPFENVAFRDVKKKGLKKDMTIKVYPSKNVEVYTLTGKVEE